MTKTQLIAGMQGIINRVKADGLRIFGATILPRVDSTWTSTKTQIRVVPLWMYNGTIMLSLSIKNVSEEVADALRERAARNHRSLQGELLHILETAVRPQRFDAKELRRRIQALGLKSPSESARFIREDRDRP